MSEEKNSPKKIPAKKQRPLPIIFLNIWEIFSVLCFEKDCMPWWSSFFYPKRKAAKEVRNCPHRVACWRKSSHWPVDQTTPPGPCTRVDRWRRCSPSRCCRRCHSEPRDSPGRLTGEGHYSTPFDRRNRRPVCAAPAGAIDWSGRPGRVPRIFWPRWRFCKTGTSACRYPPRNCPAAVNKTYRERNKEHDAIKGGKRSWKEEKKLVIDTFSLQQNIQGKE